MSNTISITTVKESKVDTLDFDTIALGRTFTDHMFVCDYKDGQWENPRITPMEVIPMHPSLYGLALWTSLV